jgi:geranylgeranyl diphosphate synthase type I
MTRREEPRHATRGAKAGDAYDRPVAVTRRATSVPPSLAEVGGRAEARIVDLLDAEIARWTAVDAALSEPLLGLRALVLAGGKRLRPAFCHWAFVGAGGSADDLRVVDAGAALELLHTFALVHDDVMDGSDTRRGLPAIHAAAIDVHRQRGWRGEARRFGEGAAILVGDLAFVYADMLFGEAAPAARRVFDELRVELCIGQYLDLVGTAGGSNDPAQADRIERYKSGKYTVERPLHLGAALAGRYGELAPPLSAVGLPLGEAFQLRDDLLGVFGDEAVTGKPVGDDLREGKLTPLVAVAAARADAAGTRLLTRVGRPGISDADVEALQELLVTTGARDDVEHSIERLVDEALARLAEVPLTPEARVALEELATFVAWRDR